MGFITSRLIPTLALIGFFLSTQGIAHATSYASGGLTISGVVPVVLSTSAEIYKDTLAFKPKEQVRDRVIGKIRMNYNVQLSAIQISSNRPQGVPADDIYGQYPFGRFGFAVKIGTCTGIDPAAANPIAFPSGERQPVTIGNALTIKSAVNAVCDLVASWDGAEQEPTQTGRNYTVDYSISLSPTS